MQHRRKTHIYLPSSRHRCRRYTLHPEHEESGERGNEHRQRTAGDQPGCPGQSGMPRLLRADFDPTAEVGKTKDGFRKTSRPPGLILPLWTKQFNRHRPEGEIAGNERGNPGCQLVPGVFCVLFYAWPRRWPADRSFLVGEKAASSSSTKTFDLPRVYVLHCFCGGDSQWSTRMLPFLFPGKS